MAAGACRPNFLLPVKVLGEVFRGKYLEGLRQAHVAGQLHLSGSTAALAEPHAFAAWLDTLYRTSWVVYAKKPFGRNPEFVLKYLARYTHRVAFSNARLVRVHDDAVTFTYKDYAADCRIKELTLPALEFLRRFALHVVPGRLVRIRQYGLLANRGRGERLERCRRLLTLAPAMPATRYAVDRAAQPPAPTKLPDVRLMLLLVLLATATPAELASLAHASHTACCSACGLGPVRTLWQLPRTRNHALPDLRAWPRLEAASQPLREDSS